ncbi:RNA polymerase ECF-type sigma factor [Arcticibacter svalbardensis MN12-7]|uniref:RNA polymerase ECF-type sigma factor n=1 Tax=Arcticibacter svalbardensis MN12-7 TaxID=1150600 RepID=R9H6K2_9SPHI|nr:RNA polymerase sigma-70 factor [Arcticibacter svalbardensis]EOR96799.1 RNA polymerase ECF-type sigma factor [Arcticibacter svalbardensis MN12-7]
MTAYQSLTDLELTNMLKIGDHSAYTEIYSRYNRLLYIHAYNKLRDREAAKDILQELFTALWNNKERFIIQTNLSGYLYTAIRNRILKLIAHKSIEGTYVISIQNTNQHENGFTDHRLRENQLATIIEREIAKLPEKMREVFLLSRKDQLSHSEISNRLGIAEPTVKKQVNNALKILRVKLQFGPDV